MADVERGRVYLIQFLLSDLSLRIRFMEYRGQPQKKKEKKGLSSFYKLYEQNSTGKGFHENPNAVSHSIN